jgi:hypothetical protein
MINISHRSSTQNYGIDNDDLNKFCDALFKPCKCVKAAVNTHIADHVDRIGIDDFAGSLLADSFPIWMPKSLQRELKESLRGFTPDAALWIAESLIDCYCGQALTTTGIKHIDDMLWTLYAKILNCAREKGIKIANHL